MKNGIKEFSEGDFQELNHLKILSLSYNQIKEFPDGIFQELSQLENLDLSSNHIKEVGIFQNLSRLKSLNQIMELKNSQMEFFKNQWRRILQKISQLRILRLDSSVQNIDEIRNVLAGPVRIQHRIPIK